MSTETVQETFDVFVAYSLTEGQTAELIERALSEAGFDVTSPAMIRAGERWEESLWHGLAESDAVVAVIDPSRSLPSVVGVEVGAAMAWHKPLFIVYTETGQPSLPSYLKSVPAYPISRIDDLVHSVQRVLKPLSQDELAILIAAYSEQGVPVDRLLGNPAESEELYRIFNERCSTRVGGERLVQELVRLRKSGRLPRLPHRSGGSGHITAK